MPLPLYPQLCKAALSLILPRTLFLLLLSIISWIFGWIIFNHLYARIKRTDIHFVWLIINT
eukprot:UN17884